MSNQKVGHKGEAVAALYYIKQGYELLDHNFKTRMGELDLVLKKNNQIIVAEVKTRSENYWYLPRESVNYAKQQKVILATKRYLQIKEYHDYFIRFDVVEVIARKNGGFSIHCIQDAFGL
jgi:putative endonuclease